MCQICLQNKETIAQDLTVNQESCIIPSLYIPVFCLEYFPYCFSTDATRKRTVESTNSFKQ